MKTDERILQMNKTMRYFVGNIEKNRQVYSISIPELCKKANMGLSTFYKKREAPRFFTFPEILTLMDILHFTEEQRNEATRCRN